MATAPKDLSPDVVALTSLPANVVRELFDRERRAWLETLLWDTRDAADVAATAVGSHVIEGAAIQRGQRFDGFLAVQPGRPVARLCGGWLSPHAGSGDAEALVQAALVRVSKAARVEGQIVAFGAQAAFDDAFGAGGFRAEPREYLIAPIPVESDPPRAENVRILSVDSMLISDCARVLVVAHRGRVEARINSAFRTERGAAEYLHDIVAGQGCGETVAEASLAAVRDGRVEGFCLGTMISDRVGHVPQIAVDPDAQGEGVGSLLFFASMRALQRRGAERVTLSVSTANERAASWYRRLGFRTAARFSAYYRDPA